MGVLNKVMQSILPSNVAASLKILCFTFHVSLYFIHRLSRGWCVLCRLRFCVLSAPYLAFSKCVSFSTGNLSSLVVPAAALGALGYGYMWWKVWNCLPTWILVHSFNSFIGLWLKLYCIFLFYQYVFLIISFKSSKLIFIP